MSLGTKASLRMEPDSGLRAANFHINESQRDSIKMCQRALKKLSAAQRDTFTVALRLDARSIFMERMNAVNVNVHKCWPSCLFH